MHDIRNFAYICPLVDYMSAHRIGITNSIDKEIARMEKREIKPLAFCFNGDGQCSYPEVDLQKDDGLEYLVKMEPLFGCVDNDGRCDSHVARQFYHALNNNEIFRKKSLELAQEFIEDDALLATLDAFGLDYRKFWYLCLALNWITCKEFCFGVWNPMRVEVLRELESKLQTFAPLLPATGVECDTYAVLRTKASLELRIDTEYHPFRIEDNGTLALIWYAIDSLLDSAENGEKPWLDRFLSCAAGRRDKEVTNPELVISFYSKLDWFLKDLKGKRGVRYMSGNKEKIASASKYFLISRMIYRTGLIRGKEAKKFLDEDNKKPFLQGYLKDHRKNSRKE